MRNNIFNPFVVFSVDQDRVSDVALLLKHKEIPFKLVYGHYEGQDERSFIVSTKHGEFAHAISKLHGQKTVLEVDCFRTARLIDINTGDVLSVDTWQKAKHGAEYDAWTIDPSTGVKWVAA